MTTIDKRLLAHIDLVTLITTIVLGAVGIASIYSATYSSSQPLYQKEVYWLLIGIVFMTLAIILNYYLLERFAYLFYGGVVVMLLAVFVVGRSSGGATRWLDLGVISFQPSEFAKLALIIMLAKYFSSGNLGRRGLGLKDLITPGIILMIPFFLIAKQPDLGTALILGLIFCSIIVVVGLRPRTLVALIVSTAVIIPFAWMGLKDYQKGRLTSFMNPEGDPFGSGYHLLQSKIAIGSGGLLGKGFTGGTQGKLLFLPEQHTDFIFSIFAEEWGLVGVLLVIILFMILVLRGLNTAGSSKDRFGFILAFGISSLFFWHVIFNLGMVTGLLPVVGVPLPFLSYGGTFLIVSMIAAGILVNIRMRRFIF